MQSESVLESPSGIESTATRAPKDITIHNILDELLSLFMVGITIGEKLNKTKIPFLD